ncbi:MAG: 1-acyl-sn-glycerol-3-phosphate acyltransferase [bacterium]|nr:1-acyl-sn-glycerol-3-phosphate acyltransferase [bacterium]
MRFFRKLIKSIDRFFRAFVFVILSIPYFFLIIVFPLIIGGLRGENLSERFCASWFRLMFWIFGIKLQLRKWSEIPNEKFIIFSNHLSFLDIPAVVLAFQGKKVKFLAKEEVLKYPVIGWGLKIQNHPIVKRGSEFSSVKSCIKTIERQDVDCLCIFPEGTRGRDARNILPFKDGISFLFDVMKKKLVPVFISGTEKVFPVGSFIPSSGSITVFVGEPITYQDFISENPKNRRKFISEIMRQKIVELSKKVH